jgi:hypothetical protein
MAWRCHELDTESSEIPTDRAENIRIGLAGAAAARAHLPQSQRTPKEPAQLLIERTGEPNLLVTRLAENEILASLRRHAMIASLCDRSLRAHVDARRTENAAAQVEGDLTSSRAHDSLGRTHRQTRPTAIDALAGIDA